MSKWLVFALLAFAGFAHAQSLTLMHVHGLAWSADGKRLMIPSHHGLAVYENGSWSKAPGPQHDFMGFSATAKHLYSSGHPAHGSGFTNPFGLVRSKDGGKSWEKLGLEGETDFHLLATGWNTNAIYVWNPEPSSRMRRAGLHCTFDDGKTWKPLRAAGLEGEPHALAVHPSDPKTVAVATSNGIYLSRDSGERFVALARGVQGLSVFFDLNGKDLLYGAYVGRPVLARAALGPAKPQPIELPPLRNDAVAYIAQNPAARGEYAIATFGRSVYLSRDSGRTWALIAEGGRAK